MTDHASNDRSEHLRLRDAQPDDLPTIFRMEQDPESNRMAVANPRDPEAFRLAWARNMTDPTIVAKVIVVDGEVVGTISCFNWDGRDSIGYWIDRAHWGKGIASRALAMMLEHVTLRPLHARAARSNAASICVLEKCGFRVTGYAWAPETPRFPACEEAILLLE